MKKELHIALVNFWKDLSFQETLTFRLLSKHFCLVIDNQKPDVVFVSCFGDIPSSLAYDCPRIQVLGEPMTPDFSLFDYAIGFDFLTILDRNGDNRFFRFPVAFWEWHHAEAMAIETPPTLLEAGKILSGKERFCDFIYGYPTVCGGRENLYKTLSQYKAVSSAGNYLNNMPGGQIVKYRGEPSKIDFMRGSKFSIAGENISYPGMVTEKIVDAFFVHSVPIYFGDPIIERTFNPDSFINASSFDSPEALLAEVKRIDQDDELYLKMLCAPKYAPGFSFSNLISDYEKFLVRICSQTKEDAYRRPRFYFAKTYEQNLKNAVYPHPPFFRRLIHKIREMTWGFISKRAKRTK